jgi:cation:H+ antiporter
MSCDPSGDAPGMIIALWPPSQWRHAACSLIPSTLSRWKATENDERQSQTMELLDFKNYSLWTNIGIFAASAVVVWIAGTKIARYADKIATRSGIGHAAVGLVLLAGITSLPEIAVSVTSAIEKNAALAVNNLLGSIAMQITVLAAADALIRRQALTVVAASPGVLLQVAMNALLLTVVAAAITIGDTPLFHAGEWAWGLLFAYVFAIWKVADSEGRNYWIVRKTPIQKKLESKDSKSRENRSIHAGHPSPDDEGNDEEEEHRGRIRPLVMKCIVAGAAILVAGFLLSRTGDAIARQTGLGQSFVGAVLLAMSTSLPEVSSVVAAIRLRRYQMAISDIFGTNLFNVGMIFLVDIVYSGKPVLSEVGRFSQFAALLGAALACVYLVGLIERRDRTIAGMGLDSFAVLILYGGGLIMLYQLR